MSSQEMDKFTGLAREFDDMTRSELLHEARRWCMNALAARDDLRRYKAGADALRDDDRQQLARVWNLIDRKRKTVRTADLLAIFSTGSSERDGAR